MRVQLADPTLVAELLSFLERVRCVVRKLRSDVIEVALPEAGSADQARLELELYLLAWRALHPNADASVVSAPILVSPPQAHS